MAVARDISMLNVKEQEAVAEFIYQLGLENAFGDGLCVSEKEAIKFLMARKFDVGRAMSLFHSNKMLRGRFELEDLNPHIEPLLSELTSGKFTVLKGKGEDGSSVCLFYAKKHFPKNVDHITVLRSLVFQLDYIMTFTETQRNGLSLVYDMTSSRYQNFDFDLAMKVLHLLKGGYPARLKNVFIVSAPIWFRASLAILASFLRDKIRDRVEVMKTHRELHEKVPSDVLPKDLGGSHEHNHKRWLDECYHYFKLKNSAVVLNSKFKESSGSSNEVLESPKIQHPIDDIIETVAKDNSYKTDDISLDKSDAIGNSLCDDTTVNLLSDSLNDSVHETGLAESTIDTDILSNENTTVTTDLNDTLLTNGYLSQKEEPCLPPNGIHNPNLAPNKPLPMPPEEDFSGNESKEEIADKHDTKYSLNFEQFIAHLKRAGKSSLQKEYDTLRSMPPVGTFESTILPKNLPKNRYNNILAFEESRVLLDFDNDDPFSDYINANYVDGFRAPKKFICTQGPLPGTICDFWRMVWEQKVVVVVMITRCVERGRVKCFQYWPECQDETITCGDLLVTNVTADIQKDYTSTLLDIYNSKLQTSRRICHVQFTSWPDFGVLPSAYPIHEVIDLMEQYQKEGAIQIQNELNSKSNEISKEVSGEYTPLYFKENSTSATLSTTTAITGTKIYQTSDEYDNQYHSNDSNTENSEVGVSDTIDSNSYYKETNTDTNVDNVEEIPMPPIVIHCSAGVGRTGTFCCISNCIEQLNSIDRIDVFSTVKKIREQRAFSVQTAEQYQFCYTGLVEYVIRQKYLSGDTDLQYLRRILWQFLNDDLSSDSDC